MWDKIMSFLRWVEGILKWWEDRRIRKKHEKDLKERKEDIKDTEKETERIEKIVERGDIEIINDEAGWKGEAIKVPDIIATPIEDGEVDELNKILWKK